MNGFLQCRTERTSFELFCPTFDSLPPAHNEESCPCDLVFNPIQRYRRRALFQHMSQRAHSNPNRNCSMGEGMGGELGMNLGLSLPSPLSDLSFSHSLSAFLHRFPPRSLSRERTRQPFHSTRHGFLHCCCPGQSGPGAEIATSLSGPSEF